MLNYCYLTSRSAKMTTQKTQAGIIVATFRLPDPFQYVDEQGFDVVEDNEAEHTDLIGSELIMEFHSALQGEPSINFLL